MQWLMGRTPVAPKQLSSLEKLQAFHELAQVGRETLAVTTAA